LKLTVNTRTSIKSYIPLFISKFDADIANLQIAASQKIGKEKFAMAIDIPLAWSIIKMEQSIVIEINPTYTGG